MEKVFIGVNELEVWFVYNMLRANGVEAEVVGDTLSVARGEIPFTEETRPCVVVKSEVLDKARSIIETFEKDGRRVEHPAADEEDWTCPGCGEEIEGQFAVCWKCLRERPL